MLSQSVQTQFPEGGFSVHLDGLDCLVGVALFLTILGVPNLIWKKAYAQCLGRRDEDQFDPRKRDPAGPFMDRTRENSPVRQPWVNYNNNPENEPGRIAPQEGEPDYPRVNVAHEYELAGDPAGNRRGDGNVDNVNRGSDLFVQQLEDLIKIQRAILETHYDIVDKLNAVSNANRENNDRAQRIVLCSARGGSCHGPCCRC